MSTTTATVTSITDVSLRGMRHSVAGATLCQSNVSAATTIMTATSAAIGMVATSGPSTTSRISRETPARNVESRVRAPEVFTLIIV